MTPKEFIYKINNNEKFTSEELQDIVYGGFEDENVSQLKPAYFVTVEKGEDHRWDKEMRTIYQLDGNYYAIPWRQGLTEHQEDSFWNQPYKVTKKIEVKTVISYEPVDFK